VYLWPNEPVPPVIKIVLPLNISCPREPLVYEMLFKMTLA
jgi:hypothetical protein